MNEKIKNSKKKNEKSITRGRSESAQTNRPKFSNRNL